MPQQGNKDRADTPVMATLGYGDKTFRFLLPSSQDHISKTIIGGSFYEFVLLDFLRRFLAPGDLVIDAGANIGNHTVFFAGVCGCQVEAFEPNLQASFFLKESVRLNSLDQQVVVHEVALSDRDGMLSIDVSPPGNLGATSFKADEQGSVPATTVDSLQFGKRVALIKIDAEGMDALVIAGAKRLIHGDRPLVVCEAAESASFDRIADVLAVDDYVAVGCFNATDTYIFAPNKTAAERAQVAKLEAGGLLSVQHGLKELGSQMAANKRSLDKVALLQRQLMAAVFGGETPAESPLPLSSRIEKLSEGSASADGELSRLRERLEQQQAGLLNSLSQLGSVAYSAGDIGARLTQFSSDLARVEGAVSAVDARAGTAELMGRDALKMSGDVLGQLNALGERISALSEMARLAEGMERDVAALNGTMEDIRSRTEMLGREAELQTERHRSLDERLQASVVAQDALTARLAPITNQVESVSATHAAIDDRMSAVAAELAALQTFASESAEDLGQQIESALARQSSLSTEVKQLRAALEKSERDAVTRGSQLRIMLESAQRSEIQKVLDEQARLSDSIQAASATAQLTEQRFNALMHGRIFSSLRALKRIGMAIRHPFTMSAAPASVSRTDIVESAPTLGIVVPAAPAATRPDGAIVFAAAVEMPGPVLPAAPVVVLPSKAQSAPLRAVEERQVAQGARSTVTPQEREDIRLKVKALPTMPPAMSRKISEADLDFLKRPLPPNGLISVIMTTFNTRDYIEAAIGSILAQTHRNLELIVVDDGSSDGTREAVEAIAERDTRVKCISFGVNRGTYWCKNYGITRAKGVAITFMDSDDVSDPERLAKQYELLFSAGCAVSTCLHERRDLQGNLITVAGRTKRVAYISQMMRRPVFDLLGYFDSVRTSADDEMLRRIKRFIGADAHKTVHEVLYHAVIRDASLTQDPANKGLSAAAGGLSEPRKAYSDAVDVWHAALEKRGRAPYMPFPVVRRPFPVHDKLLVAPGHLRSEIVSVCIASFPPRLKQLKLAFGSLIDQVDLVFVYLNQYDEVPDFLNHPRVVVKIGGEDLRDNGKFYFTPAVPEGYCFTVDDDIVYPKDYVQGLIRKIELYGRKACVGLHGTVFAKPFVSYFEGRRVLHFRQSLDRDHVVDQLGTGTLAFHTSLWRPSCEGYTETGMVDAWVAVDARKRGIPLIAIERKKAWLAPIPVPESAPPSLFEEFKSSATHQTRLIGGCGGWGVGVEGEARTYLDAAIRAHGPAFGSQVSALEMVGATAVTSDAAASPVVVQRELFRLAVVGRTNKDRWKKGGILKSTHLTADMLKPLGVEVALVDLETDDPRSLGGFEADIVMVYPGDPERPDFKDVLSLVDHHALLGRAVLVNLSLNGRATRKQYICEQMAIWRALYGKRVGLMVFGDRVEDDPALAPIADTIVAIPKTLQYDDVGTLSFAERDGIFLGDYGKLCDETLLAWPVDEAIEALKHAVPDAHLFCVEQYRPKRKRDLGIEVLPFLESEYSKVLSRSRLMVSLVKYATFEMVPMEVAAMGVPVLHPKMDNSLSDYLGLGAVEIASVDHLGRCVRALYSDPVVWKGISDSGRLVARGLAWENMAAQMYLRLLNFRKSTLS